MNKLVTYLKRAPVMCTAVVLAVCMVCIVRPTPVSVLKCIDLRVLSQLFCLMLVIQAFRSIRVLDALAARVLGFCSSIRNLFLVLVGLVFFVSMAVTNDVALLTFVPLTLVICRSANSGSAAEVITPRMTAVLVVLETLAANLGSCITPTGNPQNLFLYSYYNMSSVSFFAATLKIGIPSFFLLLAAVLLETRKAGKITVGLESVHVESIAKCTLYAALLVLTLLAVFRVIDYRIALVVTVAAVAVFSRRLFLSVDYTLLVTFIGFFIFTGTLTAVPSVCGFLDRILKSPDSVYLTGILASQIISNVPAALLLSGFTRNAQELLLGVNVGGLGTLIASLASVISYRLFRSENVDSGNAGYFRIFTVYNFVFLIIIAGIVRIL
jgi:Na+/H+ antiporter NhaD/arsenite permease-like protein